MKKRDGAHKHKQVVAGSERSARSGSILHISNGGSGAPYIYRMARKRRNSRPHGPPPSTETVNIEQRKFT